MIKIGDKVTDKASRVGFVVALEESQGQARVRVRWITEHGVIINVANPESGRRTWVNIKNLTVIGDAK